MQREFVNINLPELKGASRLVCHLFTEAESCSPKLESTLLPSPGARRATAVTYDLLQKKKKNNNIVRVASQAATSAYGL